MNDTLKLLSAFLQVNVQMSLAYRADTVANILLNIMWLGWELLSLSIIFSNTETIAGRGFGQLIALLGVFRLVHTLMAALIWPNTERFKQSIRDGSMDYNLLQPVSSMFLVTFSRITVWRAWDLLLAIVLIVVRVNLSGGTTTPLDLLTFIVLTISGAVVIYSLWIVLMFEAMVKLGILNSRMKGFFDIWIMLRQFDFDGVTLAEAILKTFSTRGTKIPTEPIALTDAFAEDATKVPNGMGSCGKTDYP